jgi:ribosomal protein L11 methyltransferase
LKNFKPMRFGERLWICPGDQLPPAELLPASGPIIIRLDPGLAFGTGTHATTAMCLEWLDGAQLAGKRVIDFGCGSGVLAVAALKLGAAHATAVDIDPQALIATRDNAQRNAVEDRMSIHAADIDIAAPAHVLLANILADPLISLAPKLAGLVVPGGKLVLSGLLREQAAQVSIRYAEWFDVAQPVFRDDWARLDGVRRSA